MDAVLDVNEVVVCTSSYTITQADLDKGSVTTITMANVGGVNSNQVTTTVATVPPAILKLTKTANPVTYDQVGQIINYTYVITNSGVTTLGPAQFTVSDAGFAAPINCGAATTSSRSKRDCDLLLPFIRSLKRTWMQAPSQQAQLHRAAVFHRHNRQVPRLRKELLPLHRIQIL